MRCRARLTAAVGVVALVVAACGGGEPVNGVAVTGQPPAGGTSAAQCPGGASLPKAVNDHGAAAAGGTKVSVEAGDFFFAPTCVTATPTGKVSITVHNGGQALHNFSVAEQNIDVDVAAGQTITVPVEVGTAGLTFVCKYHRTAGMVGALLTGS